MSSRQGEKTAEFGVWLTHRLRQSESYSGFHIFFDHGDKTVSSNVAAAKGFYGTQVMNLTRLADVDLIVADTEGNIRLLIEIEERAASPKKILGNVMAILLCNGFAVLHSGKQNPFLLVADSRLIVAGTLPQAGHRLPKIESVINPRIKQMKGLSDGLLPENVELIFASSIDAAIERLKARVETILPL